MCCYGVRPHSEARAARGERRAIVAVRMYIRTATIALRGPKSYDTCRYFGPRWTADTQDRPPPLSNRQASTFKAAADFGCLWSTEGCLGPPCPRSRHGGPSAGDMLAFSRATCPQTPFKPCWASIDDTCRQFGRRCAPQGSSAGTLCSFCAPTGCQPRIGGWHRGGGGAENVGGRSGVEKRALWARPRYISGPRP